MIIKTNGIFIDLSAYKTFFIDTCYDELNITINSKEGDDFVLETNILPEEHMDGSEGYAHAELHDLTIKAEEIIKDYLSRKEAFCDLTYLLYSR